MLGGGFSGRQSWCMVLLWGSCPELLGVGSLQPALPWSAAWLLQSCQPWSRHPAQLLPAVLRVRPGPCVSPCHLSAGHGGAGAHHLCLQSVSGAAVSSTEAGLAPGGPVPAVCSSLCLSSCCAGSLLWGMAGQGRGALARAVRSCHPGSRQGAPRTAKASLTPFCSLLDGSLHKHLICKVSVLPW